MSIRDIELDKIDQNENSRVVYKEADLVDLMASMKKDGLLQPIGVRDVGKGRFDAVWGNRRIVAAKKLGWHTIPANIVTAETDDDRDILNLVENLKRQNTTLPEDGRIFCQLRDRGLSVREIAVRVGVTETRVNLAIETFEEIPKEFHKKMLNVGVGNKGQKHGTTGHISAKTSFEILKLRKAYGLNRKQTRTLMEAAKEGEVNSDSLRIAAPAMKEGLNFGEAVKLMKDYDQTTLRVFFSRKEADKLQKKTGKTLPQLLLDYLEACKLIKLSRRISNSPNLTPKPEVRIRRAGQKESVSMAAQGLAREDRKGVRP